MEAVTRTRLEKVVQNLSCCFNQQDHAMVGVYFGKGEFFLRKASTGEPVGPDKDFIDGCLADYFDGRTEIPCAYMGYLAAYALYVLKNDLGIDLDYVVYPF